MSFNQYMHPRNIYRVRPNFKSLSERYPEFKEYVKVDSNGTYSVDYKNPAALRALTQVCLRHDFNLDVLIPENKLVPTLPSRLNYILWIEDLLGVIKEDEKLNVCGIDIGTGACCIYALLGCRKNGWKFSTTEVDKCSAKSARFNIEKNHFKDKIKVYETNPNEAVFPSEIFQGNDKFHFCMCNPPFYESEAEMENNNNNRTEPSSVNTGSSHETITEGGEVKFVKRIISESIDLKEKILLIGEIIKKRNANDWHIKSIIRNKEINFKLDTGAQCNVLPLHLIKTMKGVKIRNRAPKLISYSGNTIKTIGKADLELEYKQKFYIISFIIVQSKFMPVLGLETCLEMNLIKRVNAINAESKYKCLFSGLGCLPGKYKISTDESVPPVVHPPRKCPHTLKHKIKEELDRLEQFGVIHKVTKPTKWVNSMVVIRKTNNKIRLCLDPRDLNKAIKREHFPMKTVEEVAANLKNAKVFTTLDATQGFYQIRLDEESTWLTTFNTPFGKELIIADALSRAHSTEYPESEEFEINMIAEVSDHQASNFRRNSQEDVILSRVMSYVTFGWPEKSDELPNELKDYFNISDELNICDGILLKGDRLVVPDVMKGEMLRRIHSSHLGIEKCIARARTCLFWINMPKDIKTKVENCHICQRHRNYQQKETLIQEEIPDRPWQKLATDVFYYSNHKYLVVADYYSKFFEMSKIPDVTSHTVIDRLKSHFACHGIPEILKSDNGPEYSSFEFKTFVNKYNIKHITSSPRYPQSNGFAERTVQTAKNLLKKAKEDKQDVEISLLELRNTPLKNLGLSPAEILMGRKTRSWLPIKKSLLNPTQDFHMSITDNFRQSQQQQKHYYDKTSKNLQKIHKNEHVRMRDGKQWIPAKCIETEDNVGPRSYLLQCKGATFRRNRKDILQTKEHFNESDICDKPPNIETSFKEVSNFNNSEHHSNQEEMDNGDVSDHIKIKDEGDVSDHINIKDEGDIIVSKVSGRVIRKPQRYRDT
ncbi:U6 small nuclear RNA (adenine-(43)-N(6))-methyltransferase [Nymphon striatum]|nr:U6 small nuclear RNA (adenine-(43)-N(6))-methyltransferase [Nymphon striatum]